MDIKIISNFDFAVSSIQYSANGELQIRLEKEGVPTENRYEYEMCLGGGKSEQRPTYSLLKYAQEFAQNSNIKDKTKDCYRLMCKHLEKYGDCTIDSLTTNYLQGFIDYLQEQGLKVGTVRLYFQKLACVLHDAYKGGLFDDRVLQRVKRPKREEETPYMQAGWKRRHNFERRPKAAKKTQRTKERRYAESLMKKEKGRTASPDRWAPS